MLRAQSKECHKIYSREEVHMEPDGMDQTGRQFSSTNRAWFSLRCVSLFQGVNLKKAGRMPGKVDKMNVSHQTWPVSAFSHVRTSRDGFEGEQPIKSMVVRILIIGTEELPRTPVTISKVAI